MVQKPEANIKPSAFIFNNVVICLHILFKTLSNRQINIYQDTGQIERWIARYLNIQRYIFLDRNIYRKMKLIDRYRKGQKSLRRLIEEQCVKITANDFESKIYLYIFIQYAITFHFLFIFILEQSSSKVLGKFNFKIQIMDQIRKTLKSYFTNESCKSKFVERKTYMQ